MVCIVIPAKNEEATIAQVIHDIRKSLASTRFDHPSIVVVNDSVDRTSDIAAKEGAIVIEGGHVGLGHAMVRGLRWAGGTTCTYVVSLDGDGSLLMNMGTIATIGREQPRNLIVVVWDNEEWGQTGHQTSHTGHGTDLEKVAQSCGISNTVTVSDEESLVTVFREALLVEGPWFIVAKVEETTYLPVTPIEPELTLQRFRESF